MGQGTSHPQRAITPEPEMSPGEQAQRQADMRAQQQAALDKRLAGQQKRANAPRNSGTQAQKKSSALEKLSKENLGWRNADAQANTRRWD